MKTIELTKNENKKLRAVKVELLTNKDATFSSNQRCEDKIKALALKYNVDTQIIWDSIK